MVTPATVTPATLTPATGLIQIYTGSGKGKTSAALGLMLRAAGHGLRVAMIQFMKEQKISGELEILKRLEPICRVECFGGVGWVCKGSNLDTHKQEADNALKQAQEILLSGDWDVVVLDEIFNALWFELIPEQDVLALLEQKPPQVELVLTGRNASPPFLEKADLVTEMREIKHPFQRGIKARPGIEY